MPGTTSLRSWDPVVYSKLLAQLTVLNRLASSSERQDVFDQLSDIALAADSNMCSEVERTLISSKLDPQTTIALEFFCANLSLRRDEFEVALEHCNRGRVLCLERLQESEVSAFCLVEGSIRLRRGQYRQAKNSYEEAIVAARRSGMRQLECRATMNLGLALKNSGDLVGAERALRHALTESAQFGQALQGRCELNLANVLVRRGEWRDAIALAQSSQTTFRKLGLTGYANSCQILEARVLRLLGRPEAAQKLLYSALDESKSVAKARNTVIAMEFMGDCAGDLGDFEHAADLLREALILARGRGAATDLVVECSRALARAELGNGNQGAALALIEESVRLARAQGDVFELAGSLIVLADVQLAIGLETSASSAFVEAHELARQAGCKHEQALSAERLALIALRSGRAASALDLSTEARMLFEQIGAAAHLASSSELLTRSLRERGSERQLTEGDNEVSLGYHAAPLVRGGIITGDPRVRRVLETIAVLAPQAINILILGESGTGKELIAQAVHRASGRTGPLVPVNCSAFPGDLIEGELFGHSRGAYTGADKERPGLFEFANKGTLFLDEIGDMPIKAQARLLRALESGEVRRLGENTARNVDVRVVAATHRHLMEMVGGGQFRLDLYYRLAGYVVELPAIRDRQNDATLLIEHYLHYFNNVQGKTVTLSSRLRSELATHSWPGNVREIKMVMHRLVSLSWGNSVIERLPFALDGGARPKSLPEVLEAEEKRRILDALQAHNWNKSKASTTLGTSRTTLIGKMKRMGISLKKS